MGYDSNILKKAGVQLDADGKLSARDQIAYDKAINNDKLAEAERFAHAEAASARAAATMSPELEQAQILWERTKKYMPTAMKQAGLDGLGVSQSMIARAQSDYHNQVGALARERNRMRDSAGGLTMDAYRAYVEQIEGENRALDLSDAKLRVEEIYGNAGWSENYKEEKFSELLAEFDGNAEIQNALLASAKGYQDESKAWQDFIKRFGSGTGSEVTLADYEEAAAGGDFWDSTDEEALFSWYASQDEGVQVRVDDYLESCDAMSVEVKAKELDEEAKKIEDDALAEAKALAEADDAVIMQLLSFGAEYNSDGSLNFWNVSIDRVEDLLADESVRMSEELRKYLENAVKVERSRQVTLTEDALKEDFAKFSPEKVDAATAKAYLEKLEKYLNEGRTPNTDLISEKFYNEHLKPELDSFAEWEKYLDNEAKIKEDTYNKWLAGESAIEGTDGKKWYIPKSFEGDVESFMEENKGAVDNKLSKIGYADVNVPNIQDGTTIKVKGTTLYYDKKSDSWKYVTTENPKEQSYSASDGLYIGGFMVNGKEEYYKVVSINTPKGEKILEAINALDLGDVEDGKTIEMKVRGYGNQKVFWYGDRWFYAK